MSENGQIVSSQNSSKVSSGERLRPHWFQPGQSGNPGGRPKKLTRPLEKLLDEKVPGKSVTYAEEFAAKVLDRALKRSDFMAKEIFERIEGKVPQAITGADGGPVQFQVNVMYGASAPQDVVVEAISADNDAIDAAIESPEAVDSNGYNEVKS